MSVRGSRARVYGDAERPLAVIFVDLFEAGPEALRQLPPTLLRQRGATLLVRASTSAPEPEPDAQPDSSAQAEELRILFDRWDVVPRFAVLHQPVGAEPWIETVRGQPCKRDEWPDLVGSARAVELEALLEWGRAIWRPSAYHYRLPSGEHAGSYVKLADAIREPRDATVLTSWLARHLRDSTGLVIDTGTLTPVALEARRLQQQAGFDVGAVAVLDQYPRTAVDIEDAILRAAGDYGSVLAVLSISSSGRVLERLRSTLNRHGPGLEYQHIEVLIDKAGTHGGGDVTVWSPLPGQRPLVERGSDGAEDCDYCRNSSRARIIPINPFSFDGMLPAQLRQITPDFRNPSTNAPLWEAADRAGAIAVEARPHAALARFRSEQIRMSIVLDMQKLIADAAFIELLKARIGALIASEHLRTDADVVLVPMHERDYEHFDNLWSGIQPTLAPDGPELHPFPLDAPFSEELRAAIRDAKSVLVLCLGIVTGASLQKALTGIQTARDHHEYNLNALAVHARPATPREWKTLTNSYGRDEGTWALHAAWITYLPERSPLQEERAVIEELSLGDYDGEARAFLEERLRICIGTMDPATAALFWGAQPETKLTPNSIYGQGLGQAATYAAVGAAVNQGLLDASEQAAPEFRVFEMAAMVRSYYDVLILASFLRWMRPHEVWWGWQAAEAVTTVQHMLERSQPGQRWVLVPELLLAAAQGKLTKPGVDVVRTYADTLRRAKDTPSAVRAALEIGEAVLASRRALLAEGPPPAVATPASPDTPH